MEKIDHHDWDGPEVTELSDADIKQQDFVDNTTRNFLCELAGETVEWNIETISAVRDVARQMLYKNHGKHVDYAYVVDKEEPVFPVVTVKCDEPGCGWKTTSSNVQNWHNVRCPKCGNGIIVDLPYSKEAQNGNTRYKPNRS